MVFSGAPSLLARLHQHMARDEEALAEALAETADELTARLLAGQVVATQRVLARRNWRLLADGRPIAEVEAEAVRAAEQGFAMLPA
jgi:hypothetical protein